MKATYVAGQHAVEYRSLRPQAASSKGTEAYSTYARDSSYMANVGMADA